MADKLRSVNTRIWEDTFIEKLNVSEKLLFVYLLTNSQTNILGIYEISLRRISYDTGILQQTIEKAFESFGTVQKAYFINNFVILPNFLKNQKLNANMKIGAAKIFNNLPEWLKISILGKENEIISNDSKGFEMVRNGLVKYEIEIKKDESIEIESKIEESDLFIFDNFRKLYLGTKKGNKTEFENFIKKTKDWKAILPNLKTIIENQIKLRAQKKENSEFVPEWKNLQTWINQRCWEDEIIIEKKEQFTGLAD